MCDYHQNQQKHKWYQLNQTTLLMLATVAGLLTGWLDWEPVNTVCQVIADLFLRLLKLVSLPIIFFSLVSTLSGMGGFADVKALGGQVLKYTLMTTLVAAALALCLYLAIDPASALLAVTGYQTPTLPTGSYWSYLLSIIPSNFIEPFHSNNVMGVFFLAILLSSAVIALSKEHKSTLHAFFESMFAAVMKMTSYILLLIPLAVWAFITLFIHDLQSQNTLQGLAFYLACVLLANVVQAGIILPLFLYFKGISPWQALRAMWPALTVAFFAKSSSAALPSAMDCAEKRLGVNSQVARFSLPLCITINMNACAAFILITVLFVSQSHGVTYSPLELVSWIFIASIAALGNAGVPMGCYMLSSAFLAAMGIPLQLLVIILPFYAFIDMLESGINVWSDACVTAMVNQDLQAQQQGQALCKNESPPS